MIGARNNRWQKSKKGFTLIELLLSAAIFALTVTIGIDLFFTIVKIQKRTSYIQDLQSDARYVLEIMAREIRLGNIDYAYYADVNPDLAVVTPLFLKELRDGDNENKVLATRDQDNNRYFFERVAEGNQVDGSLKYVIKVCSVDVSRESENKCHARYPSPGDYTNWVTITPEGIHVEKFLIFISPEVNPFVLDESEDPPVFRSNSQPLVTLILQTKTDRTEPSYKITTKLQTTVSSRTYVR